MSSSIQLSPEALCDGLDQLSIQQLELMDQLIKNNMRLEENMRSGFFHLGKTRYTLGSNAVSPLQLPTNESDVQSLAGVVSTPVVLEQQSGDIMYHTVDAKFLDPLVVVEDGVIDKTISLGSLDHFDDKNKGIRKRVSNVEGKQKVEEISEGDLKESDDKIKVKTINRDPIRWFSVLPPQTLKHAQQDFKTAIQLIAQCATSQLKLRAVSKEYKRLLEIKCQLDRIEKEA
ncbi:coiled-coil domain-containing protein 115 [Procambarus clarkii]|uniref:coiled-coil domain-containing protein 115 n=1 Tax=Procambarus clarkii TaxID=6728 RepID=UPI001E673FD3|nr:uncharacterized protein LOC123769490 [Procambarus clarkii]